MASALPPRRIEAEDTTSQEDHAGAAAQEHGSEGQGGPSRNARRAPQSPRVRFHDFASI